MNERYHQPFPSPRDSAPPPSAVRVIPAANVPSALSAAGRPSKPEPDEKPTVLRPERFDDLTDVVDQLRAGRSVLLLLEGFADAAERRRALAFVGGAAYALEIAPARTGAHNSAILLDPRAKATGNDQSDVGARVGTRRAHQVANKETCVLCDLRTADREFEPPLEMVIRTDGSRIWSPPAMVCSHCRATIRHWQFALAWCSQCERWGRRNVVSPCGQLYG